VSRAIRERDRENAVSLFKFSKHCSFSYFLERFARHFHDEELSVQPHSWCEPLRAISEHEKAEAFQIQSADTSSAVS
jgi:hypothetical protein